jgi:hypothetical protein
MALEEFMIEEIVDRRTKQVSCFCAVSGEAASVLCPENLTLVLQGKVEYLIKWVGFPSDENTWEKRTDLIEDGLHDEIKVYESDMKASKTPKKSTPKPKQRARSKTPTKKTKETLKKPASTSKKTAPKKSATDVPSETVKLEFSAESLEVELQS